MTKQEVILEIKEFREAFNKITPEQFYFDQYVKEFDLENNCGTVCCLWGWIPKIAPKIAEKYDLYYDKKALTNLSNTPNVLYWPYKIKDYLFYPYNTLLECPQLEDNATLIDVLKGWDEVIAILENTSTLDHLF